MNVPASIEDRRAAGPRKSPSRVALPRAALAACVWLVTTCLGGPVVAAPGQPATASPGHSTVRRSAYAKACRRHQHRVGKQGSIGGALAGGASGAAIGGAMVGGPIGAGVGAVVGDHLSKKRSSC